MLTNVYAHVLIINFFLGENINNIVIIPSEIPLISSEDFILPADVSFLISAFDPSGTRIRMTLDVTLSKFNEALGLHGMISILEQIKGLAGACKKITASATEVLNNM